MINKYINPDAIEDGSIGKEKLAFAPAIESGYYSSMTVGEAENLVGRGESTKEEFSFRPSAGSLSIEDGSAKIASIKGNSVVWNQLATKSNVSIVKDNSANESAKSFNIYDCSEYLVINHWYYIDIVKNNVTGVESIRYGNIASVDTNVLTLGKVVKCIANTNRPSISYTVGANTTSTGTITPIIIDLTQMFGAGNEPTSYKEYLQRKPMNIADEYAYNEGTLVDMRVNEIKSVGDNAWDEEWENGTFNTTTGTNINNSNANKQIRSKNLIKVLPNTTYTCTIPAKMGGDSIWCMLLDKDKEVITGYKVPNTGSIGNSFGLKIAAPTFTTPANAAYLKFYCPIIYGDVYTKDICFHLEHSEYKNGKYYPYQQEVKDLSFIGEAFSKGMRSAGSVFDEIRFNKTTKKWEKVKRVDEVNLWQMNWVYDANKGRNRTNDSILNIKVPVGASTKANILTALYEAQSLDGTYLKNVGIAIDTTGKVWVYDDTYTGSEDVVAQFVSMLTEQKAVLYYELAEPEITELDIDLTPYYEIWDFGTEEAIASEASTPFRADIVYQFNAVDRIRNNSTKIEELESKIDKNTADIATKQKTLTLSVKDNGNIVIGNLDGQSKEFMPATPSGVPEHYTWLAIRGVTYGTFTGKDGNTYGQDGKWGVYAEYGGLSDLTKEDMYIIMTTGKKQTNNKANLFALYTGRTNIIEDNGPWSMDATMTYTSLFRGAANLEVANLIAFGSGSYGSPTVGTSLQLAFDGCRQLHSVIIGINVKNVTSFDKTFQNCESLRNIKLAGLKANVSFAESPLLSYESLRYMIAECESNASFTITLHSTVKTKVQTGGEWNIGIEEALAIAREKETTIDFGE